MVPPSRLYATQIKNPRDRAIVAQTINFIDADGTFRGPHPLGRILSSYDPGTHTLLNLTPAQPVPTCRLYSLAAVRDMQTAAYTRRRERQQVRSSPAKVTKACTLSWSVTDHDLAHKLESGLGALRRGNKLTLQIGTKLKRGQKVPLPDVKQDLLAKVAASCAPLGREWRAREGDLQRGVVLHYLGVPTTATATTSTEKDDESDV
ncbi:putative Translation initiation factor IF3 [Taphrina deformans PYCC 5710]|uniref:Translation initiation factor IF3 n=1 Tax=Taphrina deformans (strain PYCC 5710 / ATCC 11124 / CBS 356.35 / IMI 108563 / JCM 9778 / NBRC 8474) TaxID=1097556 RepID=R4XIG4_TAPDE|nr:putative Translation initiation factor IF3 [Taphrina deformans PYCC 5710]|eukprot:CCG83147.1 putative Translation initiation factor IF3 [Taphrina deformans PYCC 5710]